MKKGLLVLLMGLMIGLVGCGQSNIYDFILDEDYDGFIVMGTSADYPPYEWPMTVEGKDTLVGIDIELGKAIAHALNKNLRVINKGFDFLVQDLRDGKVDFVIAGMTPTEARRDVVSFSDVYYDDEENAQVLITTSQNAETYAHFDALNINTKRVGAQLGTIQAGFVEEFTPNAQAIILQDMNELFLRLNSGLIDALFTEGPVFTSFAGAYPNLVIAQNVESSYVGSAVAVQKGDQDLLDVINAVIANLKAAGTIQEWVEYYSNLAANQ